MQLNDASIKLVTANTGLRSTLPLLVQLTTGVLQLMVEVEMPPVGSVHSVITNHAPMTKLEHNEVTFLIKWRIGSASYIINERRL